MNIREFKLDDTDAVASLLKDMWILHVDKGGQLLDRNYIEEYDVVGYIKKAFEDPRQLILVAEEDNKIVGVARAELKEFADMHSFKKLVYLDDLAVHVDYRRRGIADALTNQGLLWAKQNGAEAAKAKVYTFNDKSRGLLEKHGFEDVYRYYYKFL